LKGKRHPLKLCEKSTNQHEKFLTKNVHFRIINAGVKIPPTSKRLKWNQRIFSMSEETDELIMVIEVTYETCKTDEENLYM